MTLQASGGISLNDLHTEVGGSSGTQVSLGDTDISTLIFKNPTDSKGVNEYYSTFWNKNTLTFTCDTKIFHHGTSGGALKILTGFMTEGAGGAGNITTTGNNDAFGDDHGSFTSDFPIYYQNQTDNYYYQTNFGSCSDKQIRINGGPIREILSAFTTQNAYPQATYSMHGLYIGVKGSHGTTNGLNTTLGCSGTGRMQANTVCKQGSDPVSDPSGGEMNTNMVGNYIAGGGSDFDTRTYTDRVIGTTLTSGTRYTSRSANRGGAMIQCGKPDYRLDLPTSHPAGPYGTFVAEEPAKTLKVGLYSTYTSTAHTLYHFPRDRGHASADDPGTPQTYYSTLSTSNPSYAKFLAAESANSSSYDATGTVHNYPTGAHHFRHGASITLTFS